MKSFCAGLCITIQQTHTCGHVFSHVLHLKEGASYSVQFDATLGTSASAFPGSLLFTEVPSYTSHVEASGDIEKLELNGLDWRTGKGLFCPACGENLLFGDTTRGDEPETT